MGGIAWNNGSAGSSGGTELMGRRLERSMPAELLEAFQIHLTHKAPVEPGKIQVLWSEAHYSDPTFAHLAYGGWQAFHRFVFCSNWQAQGFIDHFGIPWSRCVVLLNAIKPVDVGADRFEPVPADRPIRLVYTSNPSRGLLLLYHVFKKIAEERDDVELDVFSSFKLYGWADGPFEELFDALRQVPRVTYHGAVSNEEVRKALADSHVFAYPSTFMETSCLALMEAMSAGLACVHPNFGALFETAGAMTEMYQWHQDHTAHAHVFYQHLTRAIDAVRAGDPGLRSRLAAQKSYADACYDWDSRAAQWEALLRSLVATPQL
jgi:glycosyltransferase involved in cell wall biosynthesis